MTVRSECTEFLQWCLPKLQMRWAGFRRVRTQVCKRIARRIDELGLDGFAEYRRHLESDRHEWPTLDRLCRVTISRFYRDREVFDALWRGVIPELAHRAVEARRATVDVWSCGCASGEEPYTLAMAWDFEISHDFPGLTFRIRATDSDDLMIERARRASYRESSLRDLPERWRDLGFVARGEEYHVVDHIRAAVSWTCEDVRSRLPSGPFDLVLCRNLVFTYYQDSLQRRILDELAAQIRPGGALVVGSHESIPETAALEPYDSLRSIYRRVLPHAHHGRGR